MGQVVICPPVCTSKLCDPSRLDTSCLYSKLTHIFDNTSTVIFAVFMSIWGTLFLEFWKRRLSELAWNWDLLDMGIVEVTVRPEFVTQVKTKRLNPITQIEEPYLPPLQKCFRFGLSTVSVLFFLCLVLACVFGVIVYRVIVVTLIPRDNVYFAKIGTSMTAAMLNLVFILILGRVYNKIAWHLTMWEYPKTQQDFENSFTLKMFLFNFINYYSSLFYIAFFKGNFSGAPGEGRGSSLFGFRQEECDPSGCMVELLIQLFIIMFGKQFLNNFMEICFPILWNWWRSRSWWKVISKGVSGEPASPSAKADSAKNGIIKDAENGSHGSLVTNDEDDANVYMPRWEKDYNLNSVPPMSLFYEYLEMVVQYGFVTLFVAAFPLAPLFAFVNNVIEIRLDAYKFVTAYRRPTPFKASNIGIWYVILDGMSWIAVVTNACVVAFTSEWVPRMMYRTVVSCTDDLGGYVEHSLAYFDVNDYQHRFSGEYANASLCRYRDYRNPPCSALGQLNQTSNCDPNWFSSDPAHCEASKYRLNMTFWHVFAARVAFVLVFEHLVFVIKGIVAYLIPDMPTSIFVKVQREKFLARKARIEYELTRRESAAKKVCMEKQRRESTGASTDNPKPKLTSTGTRTGAGADFGHMTNPSANQNEDAISLDASPSNQLDEEILLDDCDCQVTRPSGAEETMGRILDMEGKQGPPPVGEPSYPLPESKTISPRGKPGTMFGNFYAKLSKPSSPKTDEDNPATTKL